MTPIHYQGGGGEGGLSVKIVIRPIFIPIQTIFRRKLLPDPILIIALLGPSLSHSVSPRQPLQTSRNFNCLTSLCQFWQPCCRCQNKAKAMLLKPKQNKSHFVDVGTKQKPCCNAESKQKPFLCCCYTVVYLVAFFAKPNKNLYKTCQTST